jgi:hypothetical protein
LDAESGSQLLRLDQLQLVLFLNAAQLERGELVARVVSVEDAPPLVLMVKGVTIQQ